MCLYTQAASLEKKFRSKYSSHHCRGLSQGYGIVLIIQADQTFRFRDYKYYDVVVNDDSAIVGRVMSDGVKITLTASISQYKLCLRMFGYLTLLIGDVN